MSREDGDVTMLILKCCCAKTLIVVAVASEAQRGPHAHSRRRCLDHQQLEDIVGLGAELRKGMVGEGTGCCGGGSGGLLGGWIGWSVGEESVVSGDGRAPSGR